MSSLLRGTAQGELSDFRLSAATLLTRGRGTQREMFLVRRSPELRFFPGYWALPGGVLDAVDGDPHDGTLEAYLACAARELFEETGVLPAALAGELPVDRAAERRELRRGLDSFELRDTSEGRRANVAWEALVASVKNRERDVYRELDPFCWTTTPAFAPRRYRALYVHMSLPAGEAPTIHPGELVEGAFFRPEELWQRWQRGELPLVPPLVYLLESMAAECPNGAWDLDVGMRAGAQRSAEVDAGALHVVTPAPGIAMAPLLTPTLPPATTTNCYIVGRTPAYIVDPATYDAEERARLVTHLERERNLDLRAVLVTHHHPDHVGAVQLVAEHFDVPVLAHARTLERLPFEPSDARAIDEGERLALDDNGWHLEVLHTPGHADGHLCFRESRHGALIAGDLASTVSTIVIDPPEGHLRTYIAQLKRVREHGIGMLLPSHGPAAPDGERLLESYLRHRARREAALLDVLAKRGPARPEELVLDVYADVPAGLHALAMGSLRAGLHKLEEERRAAVSNVGKWSLLDTRDA